MPKIIIHSILFLFFVFPIISWSEQEGQRWRIIVKSESGNSYYIDQDSLTITDHNTARAWYKIIPNKKSSIFDKIRNLKFFGIQMSDASYYKLYCEIDCMKKSLKILITTAYTAEDKILRREETLNSKWTDIPNQSSFDMIRDIVCGLK